MEEEALRGQVRALNAQVMSLRTQVQARTQIALAQGLLIGRYELPDAQAAFDALRQVSQRYNIKLHQIAAALTTTPPPSPGARQWLPGRTRTPAPPLDALHAGNLDPANQSQVLRAALERAMTLTHADFGNVQLAEAGLLRLEQHRGHPQQLTDYFAFVRGGTVSWRAAATGRQVTVRDVATAPVIDDETRQVLLDSGSRAVHCIPLTAADGTVRGVISAHHTSPQPGLDQEQLARLDHLQRVVGAWLQWHTATIVCDALQHLHHTATASAGPPRPRS
ncbi:GAF and ANTAR domain-containing protein [Streptomyces sp. NPDC046939]|uniref:GAF and ANTAR domain-containing protein n=1 Tax=Streptomyces sp. NPDC046939 TaxID=3155376 RepID=UPI0033F1F3B6